MVREDVAGNRGDEAARSKLKYFDLDRRLSKLDGEGTILTNGLHTHACPVRGLLSKSQARAPFSQLACRGSCFSVSPFFMVYPAWCKWKV
jgi:hypothetical protein